ncbi:carbohydrate kinase family protein [Streptosporangium sp. NPDC000239]|uniref:carbohydrate kinase family protein n=1 Tax=Streptosporangium sp. NPDC000239 TaxID=3154248 RepID=UPI00332802B1
MTRRIVVAGVVSLYVSVGLEEFPVRYSSSSSPRWIATGVSGAAGHIARVLSTLGDDVRLCTVFGRDLPGLGIAAELGRYGLLGPGVVEGPESSVGVALVDPDGHRMGLPHLTPVNTVPYPVNLLEANAHGADLLVLTNARFVRELVEPASRLGIPIAVDVHLVSDLDGEYNRPWLDAATIVFCSDERLPDPPEVWVRRLFARYPRCRLAGVGLGARGALLATREGTLVRVRAVAPRGVVNTTGAGDALFATFLHFWCETGDPVRALRLAVLHAGWKVGDLNSFTTSLTLEELSALDVSHPPDTVVGRWDS